MPPVSIATGGADSGYSRKGCLWHYPPITGRYLLYLGIFNPGHVDGGVR